MDLILDHRQEQRRTLMESFQSVKTEFYDLDGMSWDKARVEVCCFRYPIIGLMD
jgi:hypothetical protein